MRTNIHFLSIFGIVLACATYMPEATAGDEINTFRLREFAATERTAIRHSLAEMEVPGAVVILRSPKENWQQAFGHRSVRGTDPVHINDHYRVGSVTKMWTATVILQLVDEGKLHIDDPVSRYLNGVPNGDIITIAQLLGMRSGLHNYTTDKDFQRRLFASPTQPQSADRLLSIGLNHPVSFAPGERFEYSNTNTFLLGRIIEEIERKPAASAIRQRLFLAKGLRNSYLPQDPATRLPRPFVRGYTFDEGPQATTTESKDQQHKEPRDATEWSASWGWTAGAGISTAPDMAEFIRLMVEGGYLSKTLQQRRLDSCKATAPGRPDYCWGMVRMDGFYGHSGELPGYNNFVGHDPQTGITLVVWTSLSETRDGRSPAAEIAKMIITDLRRFKP